MHEAIKQHQDRPEPWLALMSFAVNKGDHEAAKRLMQAAEQRFKDKSAFRLAQIRFWSRDRAINDAGAAALKQLEADIKKFTEQEQSTLWQAVAEAYYYAKHYPDCDRALRVLIQLPQHTQDVRVRMQLLEVVLLQDDDQQARVILKDIKRLEGDSQNGADWSFGEAQRLMREGRKGNKASLEQAQHLLT